MNHSDKNGTSTKHSSWVEWSFKRNDRYESESTRRIIQSVISSLIGAAILGTAALVWSQRDWITQNSQSIWNFLKYPLQFQLWFALLIGVASNWIAFRLSRFLKKHSPQSDQFLLNLAELNKQILELKTQDPQFIDILNYIIDDNRAHGLKY